MKAGDRIRVSECPYPNLCGKRCSWTNYETTVIEYDPWYQAIKIKLPEKQTCQMKTTFRDTWLRAEKVTTVADDALI